MPRTDDVEAYATTTTVHAMKVRLGGGERGWNLTQTRVPQIPLYTKLFVVPSWGCNFCCNESKGPFTVTVGIHREGWVPRYVL